MSKKAMTRAFNVLKTCRSNLFLKDYVEHIDIAIKALEEALASEQEHGELEYRCCPHDSDCAVHNMPAYPAGPCDCTYKDTHNLPLSGEVYEVCLALTKRALEKIEHENFGRMPNDSWTNKVLNVYHFFDSNPKAKQLTVIYTQPQPKQEQGEPVAKMTAHRAAYFMERFKREEKLLGPNEKAAVDFVIDMLNTTPQPAPQDEPKQEEYLSKAYRLANDLRCHLGTAPAPHPAQKPWVGLTDEFGILEMTDIGKNSLQLIFESRKHADEFKAAHGIKE